MAKRGIAMVLVVGVAAGCGGGARDSGDRRDDAAEASNPRVRAVLSCLSGGGHLAGAYELGSNAISVNTEQFGLEIYFEDNAADAQRQKRDIEKTGLTDVRLDGTVVQSWSSAPTPKERAPIAACLTRDPGP